LVRIVKAAGYSWQGITACYQNEATFRKELLLLIVLTSIAMWLSYDGVEWHELSKLAKDMGSAAVFVMMGLVLLFWATIIISHLNWSLF